MFLNQIPYLDLPKTQENELNGILKHIIIVTDIIFRTWGKNKFLKIKPQFHPLRWNLLV